MRALGNNMDCLSLVGNPSVGQVLGTDGRNAVWVNVDPTLPVETYAGMLRWDGTTARIVLCDGKDGRAVYIGEPVMDNGTCCRKTSYFKFRTKPLCIPAGGQAGQYLQYNCGRYRWVDLVEECDCVGLADVQFTITPSTLPYVEGVQTVVIPGCLCAGRRVIDVDFVVSEPLQ